MPGYPAAIHVVRHDNTVIPGSILRELEREAAHLTRRDGRRRLVVQWGDDPPTIEPVRDEGRFGLSIFASIDLA